MTISEENAQATSAQVVVSDLTYLSAQRVLQVTFATGATFSLPAEYLRVESPSAEVQGHSPSEKKIIAGRRFVGITALEPVGNYAVRIVFDDLHETGLYSWQYLDKLARNQDKIWADYLCALKERGLSRDPEKRPM